MMQPGRTNVGAAIIAHCAEHLGLKMSKGHVVGEAASVDLSVVMTVRIAANDKHMLSTVASHVGQPSGLVVEQKVRDCPGHAALKRGLSGSAPTSCSVVFRGCCAKKGLLRKSARRWPYVSVHPDDDG